MPVGLCSEEEVSDLWISFSNPFSTLFNGSPVVDRHFVTSAVSVSRNSSVPFLPNVCWCSPGQDSVDVDSDTSCESSSYLVSGIGVWAW